MTLTVVRNSRPNYKKKFKNACPPHRVNDIDSLVKQYKGDEEKIAQAIQQWWDDEPVRAEAEWQDVNKKNNPKKKQQQQQQHGSSRRNVRGRGPGRGRGRDERRTFAGERAAREPQVRSGPPETKEDHPKPPSPTEEPRPLRAALSDPDPADEPEPTEAPVSAPRAPTLPPPSSSSSSGRANVWATKGSAHLIQQEAKQQQQRKRTTKPPPKQPPRGHDSRPDRDTTTVPDDTPLMTVDSLLNGQSQTSTATSQVQEASSSTMPADAALGDMLSEPSWNICADAVNAVDDVVAQDANVDPALSPLAPAHSEPAVVPEAPDATVEPEPVAPDSPQLREDPSPNPVNDSNLPDTTVSMGRWDVNDENAEELDFGFGSFGNDNEESEVVVSVPPPDDPLPAAAADPTTATTNAISADPATTTATTTTDVTTATVATNTAVEVPPAETAASAAASSTAAAAALAASLSPPRPPPGLTIGGMPPMPPNALPVHELEKNMESVSIQRDDKPAPADALPPAIPDKKPTATADAPSQTTAAATATQPQPPLVVSTPHSQPDTNPVNPNYAGYNMNMYNYNGTNGGFMGIHAHNLLPQGQAGVTQGQPTQQPPKGSVSSSSQQQQPQAQHHGLYNSAANNNNNNNNNNTASDSNNADNSNSVSPGIPPPGMPAMPYNPMGFYGQQYYQMGQPSVGYGYGQIHSAVAQSGFGYQQVMGQNGGYGQHQHQHQHQHQPYADHDAPSHSHSHHNVGANSSAYQTKNSNAGYRGRQYQNQYNHGPGYGAAAQPYNMGYGVDRFPGGYVHDPYGMPSYGTNFGESDDAHKGKRDKGGRGFSNNVPQFQPPQQQQQQQQQGGAQGFGFQGNESTSAGAGGGGASNGGWSNPGWTGASWQGN